MAKWEEDTGDASEAWSVGGRTRDSVSNNVEGKDGYPRLSCNLHVTCKKLVPTLTHKNVHMYTHTHTKKNDYFLVTILSETSIYLLRSTVEKQKLFEMVLLAFICK